MKKHLFRLILAAIVLSQNTQAQEKQPPMMGWSSWNTFHVHINEALIKATADAMVNKGLKEVGYNYVNIDDGYFGGRTPEGQLFSHLQKFPNGMKEVADYIHSKGLKAGIYTDAGSNTCGSIYDADSLGIGVGLWQHDEQDCRTYFKDWGYDYLKVDWCGGENTGQTEQQRYTRIYECIRNAGRPGVRFNLCRWQFPGTWAIRMADSWRIHTDINPHFSTIDAIIEKNLYLAPFASPGHYNDMDMLEVGRGLSPDEERTHFGIWCMMSSPLMIGCDLRSISDESLAIITNKEVIAVNQDALGLQAQVVNRGKEWLVLSKPIEELLGNQRAVALYNRGNTAKTLQVSFSDLCLAGKVQVRDLWQHKDLGSFSDTYETIVPPHGTALFKMTAEKARFPTSVEGEYAFMQSYLPNQKDKAHFAPLAGASGDYVLKGVGNTPDNWAEFTSIYLPKKGYYTLTLFYYSGEKRDLTVSVNGENHQLSQLYSGGWDQPGQISFKVKLRKGKNSIRLSNPSGWAPDIDKLTWER